MEKNKDSLAVARRDSHSDLAVVDLAKESPAQKKARFERDALQYTSQLCSAGVLYPDAGPDGGLRC